MPPPYVTIPYPPADIHGKFDVADDLAFGFAVDGTVMAAPNQASSKSSSPVLRPAPDDISPSLRRIVDYRKSGLSLNHVVGCPLDCGYCVRHLFSNFEMKKPHLVVDDASAVAELVGHWAFQPDVTPVQIFNRATDPFLPGVKDHLFRTLEDLDGRGLRNPVLVITRWHVERDDVLRLDRLTNLRLTVLVTWSGIEDRRLEPVDSAIAETSLGVLSSNAVRVRSILYWRPVIAGINDSEGHLARARDLSLLADATVFSGLFHREEIRDYLRSTGASDAYPEVARRKILPRETERRILSAMKGRPLFRKTSCGVAFAHRASDYNGHFGLGDVCDICPISQVARCSASHRTPSREAVLALAAQSGLETPQVDIDVRRIEVRGSTEEQRYFIQHALNYQVHDGALPHFPKRHGRAEVGWT
jgi:DNA repair photolyase